MPPVGVDRCAEAVRTTDAVGSGRVERPRFSAIVLPVTVRQSPWRRALVEQHLAARPARRRSRSRSIMWNLPVRLHVREVRHPPRRCGRSRRCCSSTRASLRDREQVKHGVGRAAERHRDGDGVLESLLGHDLAGPDALFEQRDHRLAASRRRGRRGGGRRPAADEPRPAATCRAPRRPTAIVLAVNIPAHEPSVGQALRLDLRPASSSSIVAGGVGADRLEHAHDVERLAIPVPGQDRAGVDEDASAGRAGPAAMSIAGKRLVAAREADEGVEALGVHHGLDRVGDDLAAHERGAHPLVAHRDPVGDGDRPELEREAPGRPHPVLRPLGEPVEREVAGRDLVPGRGDADLGLGEVLVAHPDGPEHRPRAGAPWPSVTSWLWIFRDRPTAGAPARSSLDMAPTLRTARRAGGGRERRTARGPRGR